MTQLTLTLANQLIDAIFDEASRRDLPPIAAAVLDAGGHLKAMQRQDGSWLNANSPRWWEGNPVLATAYALLALDSAAPGVAGG